MSEGKTEPSTLSASPPKYLYHSARYFVCAPISAINFPLSWTSISPSFWASLSTSSASFTSNLPLSVGFILDQLFSKASFATFTAISTSLAFPLAIFAQFWQVYGFSVSKYFPLLGTISFPFTKWLYVFIKFSVNCL